MVPQQEDRWKKGTQKRFLEPHGASGQWGDHMPWEGGEKRRVRTVRAGGGMGAGGGADPRRWGYKGFVPWDN